MSRRMGQRYAITFCIALKKTDAETVAMLRGAYDDNIMSQNMLTTGTQCSWSAERTHTRNSGCPTTSHFDQHVNKLGKILNSDQCQGF